MDYFKRKGSNALEVAEILTKILSKLSVKSLLICKSVCKSWLRLIHSSSFMRLHLIQSQQNPIYIFYAGDGKRHQFVIKTDGQTTERFSVCHESQFKGMVCSFNGLICCYDFIDCDVNIINPATRKVLPLPQTPVRDPYGKLGVSFRDTINDYKVFQFFQINKQLYECKVYYSIIGSWKSLGTIGHSPDFGSAHVCVNGIIYWLCKSVIDRRMVRYVLAVDWEEKFSIIRIPAEGALQTPFLVNLKGCLCLVVLVMAENGFSLCRFDIWAIHDSKESAWVRIWSDYFPYQDYFVGHVVATKNNILFGNCHNYTLYNMETRSWREIKWERGHGRHIAFCSPVVYTESLLSCNDIGLWGHGLML